MGNLYKLECEFVIEMRMLNRFICIGKYRNIMFLGRKVSRGKYLS